MEELKRFALMLVFCAAAGLIYYLLLPSGSVSQTAKGVLSALMLLCVLAPLFSFLGQELPRFSFADETNIFYDGDTWVEAAKNTVKRTVRDVVLQYTSLPYDLQIDAHITSGYGIDIKQVRLVFDRDFNSRGDLTLALAQALGVTPLVDVAEEE